MAAKPLPAVPPPVRKAARTGMTGFSSRRGSTLDQPPALSAEAAVLGSEERDEVIRAVVRLPHRQREVLVLRELEDFSYKEIADLTRTPIGTVMSRLWRARRLLVQAAGQQREAS